MRRLAAIVVACFVLLPIVVLPVAAQIDENVLTTTVTVGASRVLPNGAFSDEFLCKTGYSGTTEFRCAFEFDLSAILSESKITAATLSLRRIAGCPNTNNCQIGIRSYKGNGSADLSDVVASSSNFAVWTPLNNNAHSVNVLSQILAHRNNGEQWAGFILTRGSSTVNPDVQRFSTDPADLTLTITSIPFPVDITVQKDGTGKGTIKSVPTGINCGSTCTGTFTYSEPLTLTATPAAGSIFVTWSGIDCESGVQTDLSCRFNVPSVPGPITATFTSVATAPPKPTPHPSASPKATRKPGTTAAPATAQPTASEQPAPTEVAAATDQPVATPFPKGNPVPTADTGVPPIVLLVLGIVVLGVVVGGGAYWFAKRSQGLPPPGA